MSSQLLHIDGQVIRDKAQRVITLRGINVAGDAKFPTRPDLPNYKSEGFFDGDHVSFIGRPFPLEEAHTHFSRLKRCGYNTSWIAYTIEVLRVAKKIGLYVFMDPHQDVWSRFSGGSGAPIWTLYACGLNPEKFASTQAALVQNTFPEPADFPKMIWATNYSRLACQVVFTLFFAGKDFAPKAIIDNLNIQDYLQDHFINACQHLALRIREAGDLEGSVVIGWESMNEPNRGLIGWQDLTTIPTEQKLQKGTSPTAWQAILTGSGRACEIDTWDFGGLGPYKSGTELVDPNGESAWLSSDYDDSRYGWSRHLDWKLGECLWAQHGVWNPSRDEILREDYFSVSASGDKIDYEYFTNNYFMAYYRKHREGIRNIFKDAILFCQPPVLEIPPSIKGTKDDDPNMIFAPHFYDGITLMTKKWNRYWNVDVFGILRGKYLTPAFAIKIGETAIRNCFRDQLSAIRQEGIDYMGEHPCVFTEIGIPYDMDDKYAYRTGDYSSQIAAMDANHFALEGCGAIGYTLWVYMALNNHEWGDLWNGEDLSIFSLNDRLVVPDVHTAPSQPGSQYTLDLRVPLDKTSPSFGQAQPTNVCSVVPENLQTALQKPSISSDQTTINSLRKGDVPGNRAAEAYIRPSPIATTGSLTRSVFDLKTCTFDLELQTDRAATEEEPTTVFLPDFHFPKGTTQIEVSSGEWTIATNDGLQVLKWVHDNGKQHLTAKGVLRAQESLNAGGDPGYIEACRQSCALM